MRTVLRKLPEVNTWWGRNWRTRESIRGEVGGSWRSRLEIGGWGVLSLGLGSTWGRGQHLGMPLYLWRKMKHPRTASGVRTSRTPITMPVMAPTSRARAFSCPESRREREGKWGPSSLEGIPGGVSQGEGLVRRKEMLWGLCACVSCHHSVLLTLPLHEAASFPSSSDLKPWTCSNSPFSHCSHFHVLFIFLWRTLFFSHYAPSLWFFVSITTVSLRG